MYKKKKLIQISLVPYEMRLSKKFPCLASLKCTFLRLLSGLGFCWKTGSDTFRSVLIYEKEQEPRKKVSQSLKKFHLPERV